MTLTADAQLLGGMRFSIELGSGHRVLLDASAEDGGDGSAPGPMEIVLVGLAGCIGMTVLAILRKKRQRVLAYELHLAGTQALEHPHVFVDIAVEHVLTGQDIDPVAVERSITLAETRYCPVSSMIRRTASITHTVRIIADGEPA